MQMKRIKLLSLSLLLTCFSLFSYGQEALKYSSGNKELDQLRAEVREEPTDRDNFKLRAIRMKLWAVTLQQQGIRLNDYVDIDNRLNKITRWNNLWNDNQPQEFSDEEMKKLGQIVDEGYARAREISGKSQPW